MMGRVRAKLIMLLTCAAVLSQSGPLPACMWDEAVTGCFSTDDRPDSGGRVEFRGPIGNDSPDEIDRAWAQQQSIGCEKQAPVLCHTPVWLSAALATPACLVGPTSGESKFASRGATTTFPPCRQVAANFPLLN